MVRTLWSLVAVVVLTAGPAFAQGAAAPPRAEAPAAPMVNLNTASSLELQALPGVGAATAARILEYREKNGPFRKIEEVMNVQGIGERIFLRLKPQITVGVPAEPAASR